MDTLLPKGNLARPMNLTVIIVGGVPSNSAKKCSPKCIFWQGKYESINCDAVDDIPHTKSLFITLGFSIPSPPLFASHMLHLTLISFPTSGLFLPFWGEPEKPRRWTIKSWSSFYEITLTMGDTNRG
ncbi:hypothetical protein GOODEAATRI_000749 [Goodea atripinnis]|uniref:Uncharacterized protein n=1 Tax=Goodea atripinnis TaxID=208336 RepID=A0ABV0MND9_9TELE